MDDRKKGVTVVREPVRTGPGYHYPYLPVLRFTNAVKSAWISDGVS